MRPRKARRAAAHSAGDPSRVDQLGQQTGANATHEKARRQAAHRHPHGIGTMPISAIVLGKRHRRDLGDIDALAADIAAIGMLHPIVVRPDGTLIAGERRIEAAKALGWSEVPVNIVDLDAVVRGEFAENSLRKDFTLSEAVAIKRALEPLERADAKERQGERTDKHLEKFSTSSHGRALDKVANVAGKHRTTIAKAEAIVEAAEVEPENSAICSRLWTKADG